MYRVVLIQGGLVLLSTLLVGFGVATYYGLDPTEPCTRSLSPFSREYDFIINASIFVVTATHYRYTQRVDLTSLCHTLMLVPNVVWIVIEDSKSKTRSVTQLLERCRVNSVHLNAPTPAGSPTVNHGRQLRARGVVQRNAGLEWLRGHHGNSSGVVYFADDDNKYDLRLFEEIRQTQNVSVFKVAFASRLKFEGPKCLNGRAVSWHTSLRGRAVPIDMAGFAINLRLLVEKSNVIFGRDIKGNVPKTGHLESDFLEHFTTRDSVECLGSEAEVHVWHTHTAHPDLVHEKDNPSDRSVWL